MKNKIVGIIICLLLIDAVIPAAGNIKKVSNSNKIDKKINPLVSDKWIKTFGGNNYENGVSAQQTADGGYIVLGSKNADFWLIKTDSSGIIIWDKTYGGDGEEWPTSLQITTDGGYLLLGVNRSLNSSNYDILLIKTDTEGNKIWDKTFGNEFDNWGSEVIQTADGGYILIGTVTFNFTKNQDIWLIKIDTEGNKIWDRTFGGIYDDDGFSVKQTNDLGFIILGVTTDGIWLIKTDDNGEWQWDKIYNRTGFLCSIQKTTDGGYILIGDLLNQTSFDDIWIVKTDSYGEIIWEKTFDITWGDMGVSVQQTKDDGYIILGWICDSQVSDALLIKTDSNGKEIWRKTYGGPKYDIARTVQQTNDGGFIMTGDYSQFLKRTDLWLIKTDGKGSVSKSHSNNIIKQRMLSLFQNLFNFLDGLPKLEKLLFMVGQ